MASAEQVQSMIDSSLTAFKQQQEASIAQYIQQKIDEHEQKVGTIV